MKQVAAFLGGMSVLACLISPVLAASAPDQNESRVKINITVLSFNCQAFAGHLKYELRSDGPDLNHHISASKTGDGAYAFTLAVQPGHYQLFLDADVPSKDDPSSGSVDCGTQQWFTALPDHDRHLVLVLGNFFTPHSECSIAGSLPANGLRIDLVLPKGHLMAETVTGGQMGPASEDIYLRPDIDSSAYYIEHVAVEDFVLRFGGFGGTDIPMDLTKMRDVKIPYCQGEFVHNITQEELRRAFPPDFATE